MPNNFSFTAKNIKIKSKISAKFESERTILPIWAIFNSQFQKIIPFL